MLGMIVDIKGLPFVAVFDSIGIAQTFHELGGELSIPQDEDVVHVISLSEMDIDKIETIMTLRLSQPFVDLVNKADYQVHCLKLYHEITALVREMGIHYE